MMRAVVAVLLLANVLAWVGFRRGWIPGPNSAPEPERWAQQVRPDSVAVVSPAELANLAGAATRCLQAGPYPEATAPAVAAALAAASVPAGAWSDVVDGDPGQWLVYMGPYASRESLARKQDELSRLHLVGEPLVAAASGVPATLVPGLVLGRYASLAAADDALSARTLHGLHTARVVELRASTRVHLLRLPALSASEADRLSAAPLGTSGLRLATCPRSG